jgi:hypothetical protein
MTTFSQVWKEAFASTSRVAVRSKHAVDEAGRRCRLQFVAQGREGYYTLAAG